MLSDAAFRFRPKLVKKISNTLFTFYNHNLENLETKKYRPPTELGKIKVLRLQTRRKYN